MWLLARRNLEVRPGRSALFLAGYALAVGVMIALLSVGEAIVGQARDKDLVGGADLVLVPEGSDVEVLKLGGVTAMFSTIPNARFLYRQLLRGPRFADVIAEAAPTWAGRTVFLRARPGSPIIQGLASATVPALERAVGTSTLPPEWQDSPGEARLALLAGPALYSEMDHGHRPDPAHPQAARWAEWWYFNLLDAASGRYAYLSFFVAGDLAGGRALGSLSLQLGTPGHPAVRHAFVVPIDTTAIALDDVAVTIAGPRDRATVRLVDGLYRLSARFTDLRTGRPVALDLDVVPKPRAYYPPLVLRGAEGFESGYVVPAVLARGRGTIDAGGARTVFDGALAYHDHNWGYWRDVAWDWGQVQSPDARFALVYGTVHAPELTQGGQDGLPFAIVTAADGFLGVLRPESIAYGAWHEGPDLAGARLRVPGTIGFAAARGADTLVVSLAVEDVAASLPAGDPRQAGPRLGGGRAFLQMRGRWTVRGRVGGRRLSFTAPGAAETFVNR
ncbi:MAG: hypothetical protein ABIP29_10910 [Candidatus Eisenbacteria bacterium]